MTRYEQALKELKEAENKCFAELFKLFYEIYENCVGDPHVTDENGNRLTKEEVYEKLLRGDEK